MSDTAHYARGALVVLLNDTQDQVVLLKREDFRVWCLPGGGVEQGETFEDGAIREAREETGYEIEIVDRIASEVRHQTQELAMVYLGRIIGGEAIESGPETLAVQWFDIDKLPKRSLPRTARCVQDALHFDGELITREVSYSWGFVIIRAIALWLRDLRNKIIGHP